MRKMENEEFYENLIGLITSLRKQFEIKMKMIDLVHADISERLKKLEEKGDKK